MRNTNIAGGRMGILKQGKDRVLSLFLRQRLNDLLGGAGSAETFSVDSTDHNIAIRLQLAGEREPLDLLIKQYRIKRIGDRHVLTFEEIGASREWVNVLLKRFLTERRFDIPDEYGDLAEKLLG